MMEVTGDILEEPQPGGVVNVQAIAVQDLAGQLGFDVERKWATAVQVFKNADHTLLVFKEVVQFQGADPASPELKLNTALQRNVTSVVLPHNVAVEFSKTLSELMNHEIDPG
jgi:hypothetical protein